MDVGIFDLLDSIPVPIFLKDTTGYYRECNAAFAKFIGLPKHEIIGKPSSAIAPSELADIYSQMDGMLFAHQDVPQVYESSVLHSDGTWHDVIFFRSPLNDNSGEISGLVGVMYDVTENKRNEARLRKSEHRHRALVEQSSDGILTFDPVTGRITEANKQFCGMIGFSAGELLQMKVYDFVSEEEAGIQLMIKRATERAYAVVGLQKYRRKDGTFLNVEVNFAHVQVDGENLIMASIRDVTAFKKIEAEIRRQELFLRTMTQSSPLAYFVVDNRSDKIIYLNTNFCDIWGLKHLEDDMRLGRLSDIEVMNHCLPLVANEAEYAESCKPLRQESNRAITEDEIPFKDGRTIRRFSKQIRDSQDKYFGRLFIYEDVTQRKQMELVLRQSEEIYRQLFLNSPAIKIVIDPETAQILDVNQAAIDYYGYCPEEMRGMSIYDINVSGEAIVHNHMQSVRDAYGDYFQFTHRLKNGEVREVEVFSGLTIIGEKRLITSIVVDITARRQAERLLQSAFELRRRSDFINNLISENTVVDNKTITALRAMGIDCSCPLFCCLVTFGNKNAQTADDEHDNHILQNRLIELLCEDKGIVAWERRGDIGVFCQADQRDIDGITGSIKKKIEKYNSSLIIKMGVSGLRTGPDSMAKCFQEAWSALISAHCDESAAKPIVHFRDLGAFQLLASIGGQERAEEFIQDKIGKLLRYDSDKGTNYLETLNELIHNENMKDAAAKMFLHPKTLVFRKGRIEKILGVSIDSFDNKLSLAMAIKLHKLAGVYDSIAK